MFPDRLSARRGCAGSDRPLARQQEKDRRDPQRDSDDGEGIAEAQHEHLSFDNIAERYESPDAVRWPGRRYRAT